MQLASRLALVTLLAVGLVLAAEATWRLVRAGTSFEADMAGDHMRFAQGVRIPLEDTWAEHGEATARRRVERLGSRTDGLEVRWIDAPAAPTGLPEHLVIRTPGSVPTMVSRTRLDGPEGAVAGLELRESMDRLTAHRRSVAWESALSALLVLFMVGGAILWLGRRYVADPVREVVAHARGRPRATRGDAFEELLQAIDVLNLRARDAEARLVQADRSATVGRMAAEVAHELGTPLGVVRLHAQLIAEGELEEEQEIRQSAAAVVEQCDRMTGLIRRLLDFVRPSPPSPEGADAASVVRSTLKLVAPLAHNSRVKLVGPDVDVQAMGRGNRGEMQQVLLNLVVNGIQAMPDGGGLEVRIDARTDPPGRPGRWVHIEVIDEGPGVPDSAHEQVFEPFFTTRSADGGTGLGLAVSRRILGEIGGAIEVRSSPGRGACFEVWWPAWVAG